MPRKRAANGNGMQPRQRKDGRWEARFKTGIDPGTLQTNAPANFVLPSRRSMRTLTSSLRSYR